MSLPSSAPRRPQPLSGPSLLPAERLAGLVAPSDEEFETRSRLRSVRDPEFLGRFGLSPRRFTLIGLDKSLPFGLASPCLFLLLNVVGEFHVGLVDGVRS